MAAVNPAGPDPMMTTFSGVADTIPTSCEYGESMRR
jgi:hypothetical protein